MFSSLEFCNRPTINFLIILCRFIKVFYVVIVRSCSKKWVTWKLISKTCIEYPKDITTIPNSLSVSLDRGTTWSVQFAQISFLWRKLTNIRATFLPKNISIVLTIVEEFSNCKLIFTLNYCNFAKLAVAWFLKFSSFWFIINQKTRTVLFKKSVFGHWTQWPFHF